ncbi:MAG TPA: DUF192 domain-containing protein [Vulgatibacter sp.]|nr:DUF192 domain-containing protein [Vulgatibacter sp.]
MVWEISTGSGAVLATDARQATSLRDRLRGLLGTRALLPGHGLHIEPCSSIHTFFMAYPIDVLFLDREARVLRAIESLPPWRATLPVPRARGVLELPAGTVRAAGVRIGDVLHFRGRLSLPATRPSGTDFRSENP